MTETIAEKIRRESNERQEAQEDRFNVLVSEWLSCRGKQRGVGPDGPLQDEERDGLSERFYEPGRLLAAIPAPVPWMIWDKFEVLENYLCDAGEGGNLTHHPELVMLAS